MNIIYVILTIIIIHLIAIRIICNYFITQQYIFCLIM